MDKSCKRMIDDEYCGRILNSDFSLELKQRVADGIAACRVLEKINHPAILYIAAWQEDTKQIWYEFAGKAFRDLLQCSASELPAVLRRKIIDRRIYKYLNVKFGIEKEILDQPELDSVRTGLREESKKTGVVEAVYKIALEAGGVLWLKDQANVETFTKDNICLSQGCLTVVTKEMEAEEERQRAEKALEEERLKTGKLEAVGTFAGGIVHDFNNLLSIILGNVALAQMEVSPQDKINALLAQIERASMHAQTLTRKLIEFTLNEPLFKKRQPIGNLIKDSVNLMTVDADKIRFKVEMPDDLRPILCDKHQIRQVIQLILENAIEAMPDGGTIQVRARNIVVDKESAELRFHLKEGPYLNITVQDQGRGILKEHLPRIFDPYFSTKERGSQKGMGLGLSTAYSIIKKHDGHICVTSIQGVGTTVEVYLFAGN